MFNENIHLDRHIPKQHSMWAPVGPQLGTVGPRLGPGRARLGPIWDAAWVMRVLTVCKAIFLIRFYMSIILGNISYRDYCLAILILLLIT